MGGSVSLPQTSGGKRSTTSQIDQQSYQGRITEWFTTHRFMAIRRLLSAKLLLLLDVAAASTLAAKFFKPSVV